MAPPPPSVDEGLRQRDEGVEAGQVRVYSSGTNRRPGPAHGTAPRRRPRLTIAVITGLVAFLIAAAALTLPELIFGGSVSGGSVSGGDAGSRDAGGKDDGDCCARRDR